MRAMLLAIIAGSTLCMPLAEAQERPAAPRNRAAASFTLEQDVEYGKAGDRVLTLDLYLPKRAADKPRPVIVWIHGGGWQNGNKSSGAGRLAPLLAGGEFVGASIGYRLSGEAVWPAQIHDCKAAIRWLRVNAKKYNLDPERIGVWGSSAGGHLVSLLGTSGDVKGLEGDNGSPGYSSRVSCVVDYCGPSDFPSFGKTPRMQSPNSPVTKLFGGPVDENEEAARAASPVTHVTADDPPFLIVHGTKDNTVPIQQAELLRAALDKAGVSVKYIVMDGGGHGIGGPEIIERVRQFFGQQLLGKKLEISTEPIPVAAAN